MKQNTIYIYKTDETVKENAFSLPRKVYVGEFTINVWGEDFTMGRSIAFGKIGERLAKQELERTIFATLAVMDYAKRNNVPRDKVLDENDDVRPEYGNEVLKAIPQNRNLGFEIIYESPNKDSAS